MSDFRDRSEAAQARMEAMRVAEDQEHGFAVMRLVLADMQSRSADGGVVDAADLKSWTALLRCLLTALSEGNGAILDAMHAAAWRQP